VIAIVGAGIGGLAVGHFLDGAGSEYVLLEASDHAGGMVGSTVVDGVILERGPQRARLTPPLRRLVDRLGLADALVLAPELPLYMRVNGRFEAVPFSARDALRTGVIGRPEQLRVLLEPLLPGLRAGETAGDFFERKFGRSTYRRLVAPLFGGLFASDPADMPARHCLAPILAALGVRRSLLLALVRGARGRSAAPACSFQGGLQVLVDALAEERGERLRRCAPVRELRREGSRVRVVVDGGDVLADHVVLTCPADRAATLVRPLDPEAARRMGWLRYNPLAVVHLASNADFRALGYHLPLDDGHATWGVTANHAVFGREGLYTAFLGGAKLPAIHRMTDADVAERAVDEFQSIMGEPARAIAVDRARMPAWDRSWDGITGLRLPAGVHACASWNGRPGLTGRLMAAERLASVLSR